MGWWVQVICVDLFRGDQYRESKGKESETEGVSSKLNSKKKRQKKPSSYPKVTLAGEWTATGSCADGSVRGVKE